MNALRKLTGLVMWLVGFGIIIKITFSAPDTAPVRLLLDNLPLYIVAIVLTIGGYVMYPSGQQRLDGSADR